MAGDYGKSINELSQAIKINPSYAPAYVSRGYVYRKLGRADKERSDFSLARKLDSHIQLPM
jgi:Flp pilus assembly protein TadD